MTVTTTNNIQTIKAPKTGTIYKQGEVYYVYTGETFVEVKTEPWSGGKVLIPENLAHLGCDLDEDDAIVPVVTRPIGTLGQMNTALTMVNRGEPTYQLQLELPPFNEEESAPEKMDFVVMIMPSNPELFDLGESAQCKPLVMRHLSALAMRVEKLTLYEFHQVDNESFAHTGANLSHVKYVHFVNVCLPTDEAIEKAKVSKTEKKEKKVAEKAGKKADRTSSPDSPKTNRLSVKALKASPSKVIEPQEDEDEEEEDEEEEENEGEGEEEEESDEE